MSPRPRRVLYISPNGNFGGAERATEILIKTHDRDVFEPLALFLRDGPLVARWASYGIKTTVAPRVRMREIWKQPGLVGFIKRVIENEKIDIVHSVMAYGHYFGGLAALAARVPEVWFQHGPVSREHRLYSLVPTRAIMVNSEFTKTEQRKIMMKDYPVKSVTYGIELPHASDAEKTQKRSQFRKELSVGDQDLLVGIVGRIDSWKGQLEVARAFALAAGRNEALKLVIVGSSDLGNRLYEEKLRDFVVRNQLEKKILFSGFMADTSKAYWGLDILIHGSTAPEPFGLVIVEGMAHGLPVIVSPMGGVLDIMARGDEAIAADPRKPEELASAILLLAGDANLRARLAACGPELARARFSAERYTRDVESVMIQANPTSL